MPSLISKPSSWHSQGSLLFPLSLNRNSCTQITKKQTKALENSLKSQKPHIESINVYFVEYGLCDYWDVNKFLSYNTDSNWASDEDEERSDDDDSDYDPFAEANDDDDDDNNDDYEDITDEDD